MRCTTLIPMRSLRLCSALLALSLCAASGLQAQAPSNPSSPAQNAAPDQAAPELKIAITGDVPTPLTITEADLAGMPREMAPVSEEDGQNVQYEGVPLQEILKKAGVQFGHQMRGKALAGYVLAEARDGYAVVFSMGELDSDFGDAKIIVADKRDGKPLFAYQGPARLIVIGDKEGARSVRMLEKIEVVKLRK